MPGTKTAAAKPAKRELTPLPDVLPPLPVPTSDFLKYVAANPDKHMRELTAPYLEYEKAIRAYLAQDPEHEFVRDNHAGLLSLFEEGNKPGFAVRARNPESETQEERDKYIMPLIPENRIDSGKYSIVQDLQSFRDNFNVFTEGSLQNLDWSNVIVAGSAVLTPLLTPPEDLEKGKRALRNWYHDQLAPASDIDMFIYGIDNEEDAIKKMEQIEQTVKDNLLWETVTIRTRNTITIVSQYPNRHVQIVLRLYKSVSQILTGFDVDCSCFAYDGQRILTNPRAMAACITECNVIDLSRRSPSYENRLAKYAGRGFEIYCPFLDRSRIDPTIFERSFNRTVGLAKLLVMEALPTAQDRENYVDQRRREMGRPALNRPYKNYDSRNKKEGNQIEVAEWDFEDDPSGYQKFTIPYGEGLNARNIERLFYKKDMVLNGEWNKINHPPYRNVKLHRHPVFFGDLKDVVKDCCGYCPEPLTDEDKEVFEVESKVYVSGKIQLLTYLEDDPGRQEVGSFNPLGPEDYTEMAYVGETELICRAIVKNDVEFVKKWCEELPEETKLKAINQRDISGRTLLHLAALSESTGVEVAQVLIDHGVRLVSRVQDGRTALHFAAAKGDAELVRAILKKSAANAEEKEKKAEGELKLKRKSTSNLDGDMEMKRVRIIAEPSQLSTQKADEDGDEDMEDAAEEEDEDMEKDEDEAGSGSEGEKDSDFESIHMSHAASTVKAKTVTTEGYVKVDEPGAEEKALEGEDEEEEDILDINIEDWDNNLSALHYAIIHGHRHIVDVLVSEFGADARRPVKQISTDWKGKRYASGATLNLVFALSVGNRDKIISMVETLINLGTSVSQATKVNRVTAFHYLCAHGFTQLLEKIFELDAPAASAVINYAASQSAGSAYTRSSVTPLISAFASSVKRGIYLLSKGASPNITIEDTLKYLRPAERNKLQGANADLQLIKNVQQPLEAAVRRVKDLELIEQLIKAGADVNVPMAYPFQHGNARYDNYYFGDARGEQARKWPKSAETLLDLINEAISDTKEKLTWKIMNSRKPWVYRDFLCLEPEKLKDIDESVLEKYKKDDLGYTYFLAKGVFGCRKRSIEYDNDKIEKYQNDPMVNRVKRWRAKLREDLEYLESVKKILLANGAKTFRQLHPEAFDGEVDLENLQKKLKFIDAKVDIDTDDNIIAEINTFSDPDIDEKVTPNKYIRSNALYYEFYSHESSINNLKKPLEPNYSFKFPYVGEGDAKAGYVKLYNAVWKSAPEDFDTVRALTSGPTEDGGIKIPRLLVYVRDDKKLSPLSIAIARGHLDMMDLLLEIADQQYEKEEVKPFQEDNDDGSDEGSDEDSSLDMDVGGPGAGGVTDEDFEVEDANAAPKEVKCNVSPYKQLVELCEFPLEHFITDDEEDAFEKLYPKFSGTNGSGSPKRWTANPITFAILKNDINMLRRLFAAAKKYERPDNVEGKRLNTIEFARIPRDFMDGSGAHTLRLALYLGRVEMLEEFMKECAFGVFFEDIEEEMNEEEKKAHGQKFYQGLLVRGKREKEWAHNATPTNNELKSSVYQKPYHIALQAASRESIQWLKSSKPWECLMEFMRNYEGSKEVGYLKKQGDKLENWFTTWLGLKTNMEAHLIINGYNPRSKELLREYITANPELLTTSNDQYLTPAIYSVHMNAYLPAILLRDLGADFSARDRSGKNVIHMLLKEQSVDLDEFNEWIKIIPEDVFSACWIQKTKNVQYTPLFQYLHHCEYACRYRIEVIKRILELSGGKDLEIPDAEGNYPIHYVTLRKVPELVKLFSTLRPDMLFWENANGRTPVEIARSHHLANSIEIANSKGIDYSTHTSLNFLTARRSYDPTNKEWRDPAIVKKEEKEEKKPDPKDIEVTSDIGKLWSTIEEILSLTATEKIPAAADVDAELPDAPTPGKEPLVVAASSAKGAERKLVSLAEANSLARRLREKGNEEYWSDSSVLSLWTRNVFCSKSYEDTQVEEYEKKVAEGVVF